ncbi:ATP-binding cassette domain-containing protein [Peribacillus muralis]|uniref:ATP-binding cassette domain-containing protein n=1 Tax=Peribacillus muralis TaxID=264697 RepID=UPI003D08201D
MKKRIYQLSGGEQQRIAIARIILKPCNIILADEPTGNLDENNKQIILSLFHKLKDMDKTIVCVTHDKEIANSSDRVIEI